MVNAKYVRYSICECGFPILSESIPLGQLYIADPQNTKWGKFGCGGCGKIIEVHCIAVYRVGSGMLPGYLPLEIFELDEGLIT